MKKKIIVYILALLAIFSLTVTMLASCSKGSNSRPSYDYAGGANKGEGFESDIGDGIGSLPSGGVDNPNAKIIKIADATVNTEDYEGFIEELYSKITSYKGYTDSDTLSGSAPNRRATVTVRIPAADLDSFKNDLSGMGTMTYYSARKLDVSLEYSTLTARRDTLTLEIGVVEELFEIAKADGNLDRISELEKRLSSLKLDLAETNAEIAVYDNDIAYSTVNLTVYEKQVIEEPEEEPELGAFARIGKNFVKNLKDIGHFFVEFFVFFVSALPYILIIAAVVTGIIFLLIFIDKKNKKNSNQNKSND